MNSSSKIVALNSIFALGGRLLVKILSFAFTIFIARHLGESDFGVYTLIWSYVMIFAAASDFGLGMYLIRELAKDSAQQTLLVSNVIAFRLVASLFTLSLIGLSLFFTDYSTQTTYHILLAATILLFYAVQDPLDSVLQAHERFDLSSSLKIIGQLTFISLGGLFLWAGWGINGLILAALGNLLVITSLAWLLIRKYIGKIRWQIQPRLWPKLLLAAFSFGLIGFALNWSQKIDTVILSLYWPHEVIGWYNAAYNLILALLLVSNAFNVAFYPTLTKETSQNRLTWAIIYRRMFKYLFSIGLPLGVGLSILSRPIILFLYGEAYAPAITPLAILAWTIPLVFLSEFLRYTYLIIGRERYAATTLTLASLGNICFNLLLIPVYGMTAAAITTVLTEAVIVFLYLRQLRDLITLKLLARSFWKPGLASTVMMGVALLTSHLPLWLTLGCAVLSYGSVLLLLRFFSLEEKVLIRRLFKRLIPVTSIIIE